MKNVEKKLVTKCRYTTEVTIAYILALGSDSEISDVDEDYEENEEVEQANQAANDDYSVIDFNLSDNDEIQEIINLPESINQTSCGETVSGRRQNVNVEKSPESNDDPRHRSQRIIVKPSNNENHAKHISAEEDKEPKKPVEDAGVEDESEEEHVPVAANHKWRWRGSKPPKGGNTFKGQKFSLPPENFHELNPLDYFKMFLTENITKMLVDQTNLYSMQVSGMSIATNPDEIERFLGIHIMMGIMKLPSYDMYWAYETRYAKLADAMSNKRYKQLHIFIHVVDNTTKENEENDRNKKDKLFKIRPVLEAVQENCHKIEPEEIQSIDEQIIPAKTKTSGIRQYNPKKPKK